MHYAIYDEHGDIVTIGTAAETMIDEHEKAGQRVYRGGATFEDRIDLATGQLLRGAKGARPSEHHEWDPVAGAWVRNVEGMKRLKKVEVERERNRRMSAPVRYRSRNIDANQSAQDAIARKRKELEDIANGVSEVYPELLQWRDADNKVKTFADVTEMAAWLAGLDALIARRNTQVKAWSWCVKNALVDAKTAEDVEAVDFGQA